MLYCMWMRGRAQRINRLLQNIKWRQRGNMLSIPTDCLQCERVGWTCDMQVSHQLQLFIMILKIFTKVRLILKVF